LSKKRLTRSCLTHLLVSTELFPWTYHVCGVHLELPFLIPLGSISCMDDDGKLERATTKIPPLLSSLFSDHASNFLRPTYTHAPFPSTAAFLVHIPRFLDVCSGQLINQFTHYYIFYIIITIRTGILITLLLCRTSIENSKCDRLIVHLYDHLARLHAIFV
jgi:hypothetical protein